MYWLIILLVFFANAILCLWIGVKCYEFGRAAGKAEQAQPSPLKRNKLDAYFVNHKNIDECCDTLCSMLKNEYEKTLLREHIRNPLVKLVFRQDLLDMMLRLRMERLSFSATMNGTKFCGKYATFEFLDSIEKKD